MSTKQMRLLEALLTEPTITRAAEKACIDRKTAYKYLRNEEFKAELDRRRSECISDTVRYLQGNLSLCNETLIKIIKNPKTAPQIKINAINTVYQNCRGLTELVELSTLLEEMEAEDKRREEEEATEGVENV